MRIKITIQRKEGGEKWPEEYDVPDNVDRMKWAKALVDNFNATLRPGERARRVVKVEKIGVSRDHYWDKISIVTESDSTGLYDRMRCEGCHITGRRYGLGSFIKRDRQYKARAFDYCDTSVALLKKRKEKQTQ